jgi:hypothetical protein
MINTIEEANRYFKYDLVQKNSANGIRINIPALIENQFSTHYKACLCKIRKVYIQGGTKNITFTDGTTTKQQDGGVKLQSNLISRNYASIGGAGSTGIIGSNGGTNPVNQRFGVMIDTPNADTDDTHNNTIVYEDPTSVFDTGTICSLPFGQVLEFQFVDGVGTNKTLFPADAPSGTTAVGETRIEIEFYLIN